VTYNDGPYAKPFAESANRSCEIPAPLLPGARFPRLTIGARGAGIPTKLCPPSLVRAIEVHGGVEHDELPSSHHVRSPVEVNDCGTNPVGTGPMYVVVGTVDVFGW
jgi:hypothetical protein